jgi:hypothetical protein
MVPPTIKSNLAGLRLRERALSLVWGVACVLSIALVLLIIACFTDWLIDRWRETPTLVRLGLLFLQLGIAAVAGLFFILWPQMRRLSDSTLALWVEDFMPQFRHRLISAVQLNQPGADLGGMSRELVRKVTDEAEKQAERLNFAQVADHRRLGWSAAVAGPALLLAAIPFLLMPGLTLTLLARQLMLPVEIPHSVQLVSAAQEVWPLGEDITIQYRVTGEWHKDMEGTVTVTPKGDKTDSYPLKFVKQDADGAIFVAEVNRAYDDITYTARLSDGRTKAASVMKIVSRPIITENNAWTQIPAYAGTRPDGGRYEQPQPRGDVTGIPGSSVRVRIVTQKPITEAVLELRGPDRFDVRKADDDTPSVETTHSKRAMKIAADGLSAETTFDLVAGLSSYRVIVKDEHGFDNSPPPRRSLRLVPEPPPEVRLLRDTFNVAGGDFDLEGLPVVLGGNIRIPYRCDAPYGMSEAAILYRVLKKQESGNEPIDEDRWIRLPLTEVGEDRGIQPMIGSLFAALEEQRNLTKTSNDPSKRQESAETQLAIAGKVLQLKSQMRTYVADTPFGQKNDIEQHLDTAVRAMNAAAKHLLGNEAAEATTQQTQAAESLERVGFDLAYGSRTFDQKTGVFATSPFFHQVPFHAAPSPNPASFLGRTFGGGRFFLSTKGIRDSKGPVQLKSGDQIEFCVEVHAMPPQKGEKGLSARSESRVVTVMDAKEFTNWMQQVGREDERVRQIQRLQTEIFERRSTQP